MTTARISVRVKKSVKARIERAAKACGWKTSKWVRDTLMWQLATDEAHNRVKK
jgi:uncharacterized protein (DUF1778 family)